MLEQALGQFFIQQVQKGGGAVIDAVDRNLAELAVAAVYALRRENLFWLVGENENTEEISEKITLWLRFLGMAEIPIRTYSLPFQDPYVNCQLDLKKMEEKARIYSDWHKGRSVIVIATLAALCVPVDEKKRVEDLGIEVKVGAECKRASFIQQLGDSGYFHSDYVENKGDMAWRGNVVDLFPLTAEHPIRMEFEGDRLVSLRFFDLATQRSVSALSSFFIFSPAALFRGQTNQIRQDRRMIGAALRAPSAAGSSDRRSIIDIAPSRCLVARGFSRLQNEFQKLMEHFARIRENLKDADSLPPVEEILHLPFRRADVIDILDFPLAPGGRPVVVARPQTIKSLTVENLDELRKKTASGYRIHLFAIQEKAADRLGLEPGKYELHPLQIPLSFENGETKSLFLTSRAYQYVERVETRKGLDSEKWMRDMQAGDFVVHAVHGIGKFQGFKRLAFEGMGQEFLQVEYLNREYLYVPIHDLKALSRYKAFEGHFPTMDRLGGKTWRVKVYRARRNIVNFARELLDLYALRQSVKGFTHVPLPDFEENIQESFHYVETEDQKRAIRETLSDLERDTPMDRLVCGDVSFGKTEVAIRAAARVVANNQQVALLCPTTILAFQHYQTFSRRFRGLPVSIAMISRLVSAREKKEILQKVREGTLDILIGTHSLLSRPVTFKRLGLYIIDEEQRFGVFQKEKLKKARENIDVLTLTATPIPRTLSLALSGLQDISLIRTPPIGRLAVQNFVGYFSRQLVVSAILSEVGRQGQVYIVYNNIDRILGFHRHLQEWLPELPILVLHAKLNSRVIEQRMMDFIQMKYRILLSTTIIENGIDIPAVNTLIVIDADRFGLTQLYQLRGRIGRSDRQAHAYFLVDPGRTDLTEKSRKRLDAIREFSQLGAGYRIAEFDLMLRGAGSLLGNKQHGHIEALGFEYYLELIQQAVQSLKGAEKKKFQPEMAVHFTYAIAGDYIESSDERLHVYRRIMEAQAGDDLFQIREELQDQYGRLPDSMERLFYVGAARLFAQKFFWKRVDVYWDRLVIEPLETAGAELQPALKRTPFRLVDGGRLNLAYKGFDRFVRDCQTWTKFFPESE